ncbi:MAG: transposase [Methanomicrobiales archaeon]|nr:transposase [Methanomicrobiales archaeon]MDI6877700.1 transposase [Methanomicrobiales archaeon]
MAFQEIDDDLWEILRKHLPPQKPHIGRPRADHRSMVNGILFVLTTGCTWGDVPRKYGNKSSIHRFHLYLSQNCIYQSIFLDLLQAGYALQKIDMSHGITDTKSIPAKKGELSDLTATRK